MFFGRGSTFEIGCVFFFLKKKKNNKHNYFEKTQASVEQSPYL